MRLRHLLALLLAALPAGRGLRFRPPAGQASRRRAAVTSPNWERERVPASLRAIGSLPDRKPAAPAAALARLPSRIARAAYAYGRQKGRDGQRAAGGSDATSAGAGSAAPADAPADPAKPAEERFVRDMNWIMAVVSAEAQRTSQADLESVSFEKQQSLLEQYQVLYLFRDIWNDAAALFSAVGAFVDDGLGKPLSSLSQGAENAAASAQAAALEAATMASLVAQGVRRRLPRSRSERSERGRRRAASQANFLAGDATPLPAAAASAAAAAAAVQTDKGGNPQAAAFDAAAESMPAVPPDMAPESLAARRRRLRTAFDVFDVNGDGSISVGEMRRVLKLLLKRRVSRSEAAEVVKIADANGDGSVDFEEFAALMESPSQSAISGDVADAADQLGDVIAAAMEVTTLPDPPLMQTVLRWRRFQKARRRRKNRAMQSLSGWGGAGAEVWQLLQTYPVDLLRAMAVEEEDQRGLRERDDERKSRMRRRRQQQPGGGGWWSRLRRPLAARAPAEEPAPAPEPPAPAPSPPTARAPTPMGVNANGSGMDDAFRKLAAEKCGNSAAKLRAFQRATDRWRDGFTGVGDYVRQCDLLFGEENARELLLPLSRAVPEDARREALSLELERAAPPPEDAPPQMLNGTIAAAQTAQDAQDAQESDADTALPAPAAAAAAATAAAIVAEAEAEAEAPRRGVLHGIGSAATAPLRSVSAWRRRRRERRSLGVDGAGGAEEGETLEVDVAIPSTLRPLTLLAPTRLTAAQAERIARSAAAASARSWEVNAQLGRAMTTGERETLTRKVRVYLSGGLTARNLYDSVNLLFATEAAPRRERAGLPFRMSQRRSAAREVLHVCMKEMPSDKEELLRAVLRGVAPETARHAGPAPREAEAKALSTVVRMAMPKEPAKRA